MANLRFLYILSILFCSAVLGQKDESKVDLMDLKIPQTIATNHTNLVPTDATSSLTTSPAPTEATSPAPTEATSPAPTEATTVPATTTLAPTVAPTTTTSTAPPTPPTTTTTAAPPTPPPPPAPVGPPAQGTWAFSDSATNITCMVVQFAAQLNVTYKPDNATKSAHALVNVPTDAVVSGACGNESQWLALMWPNTTLTNRLTLTFQRNDTTLQYALRQLNVRLEPSPPNFINVSSNASMVLYYKGEEWGTPLATSYRCRQPQHINLTSDDSTLAASLELSQLQEEAFRTTKGQRFNTARDCGAGDVPDVVPIAVGCALGGLVLVVLATYLLGRRRSHARGYLSM